MRLELNSAIILAAAFSLLNLCSTAFAEPKLEAHFINVGKGDATLLEFPCGTILFDTGGGVGSDVILTSYLENFFHERPELERRINLIVLSHGHLDHTRNLSAILQEYDVQTLLTNGHLKKKGLKSLTEILKGYPALAHHAVSLSNISPHKSIVAELPTFVCPNSSEIDLRFLWGAVKPKPPSWSREAYKDENNHSIALLVTWGKTRTLLTGDLEREALGELLRIYNPIIADIDLYQISHHGFRSGTLSGFDEHVNPRVAILSRPKDRAWHAATMSRFNSIVRMHRTPTKIPVWSFTDSNGRPKVAMGQKLEEPYDLGSGNGQARVPGSAELDKAIYWTGRDGHIVVTLSPEGDLEVTYAH